MTVAPAPQKLSDASWWTLADDAELDVLIGAFVDAALGHGQGCAKCAAIGGWCMGLREGFEIVVGWRDARARLSRAIELRAAEDAREWLESAARTAAA